MKLSMGARDKAMIDHTRTWIHFGGADEEIFLEFGICPFESYGRMHHHLAGVHARDSLQPAERRALQVFPAKRLRQRISEGRSSTVHSPIGDA